MKLTPFRIDAIVDDEEITIFPVLIETANGNYLVDCGYEETVDELIAGLQNLGIDLSGLNGIIITHDDIDHLGGLSELKKRKPNLKIYCGSHEEDSVAGVIKSERLVQAEHLLEGMPARLKPWGLEFIRRQESIKRCGVDQSLEDNEVFANDIVVIHTPGHTKGHISLYIPTEKTVITGDALVIINGKPDIANPNYTLDLKRAHESVEKIRNLKPERLICYHGGVIEGDPDQLLSELSGAVTT